MAVSEPSGLLVLTIAYLSTVGPIATTISSVSQWLLDTETLHVYVHVVAAGQTRAPIKMTTNFQISQIRMEKCGPQ